MMRLKKLFQLQISKEWISAFSANILGVIIGIALTFGISALVQNYSDIKQVKEMLVLVEDEILTNRAWLEARVDFYQKDKESFQVILAAEKNDSIAPDTLLKHIKWVCSYEDSYAGTKNWDVFKNSGMVQKMHKPEIVSYLTQFYFILEKYSALWEEYCNKRDIVRNTLLPELKTDTIANECLKILCQNKECLTFMKLAPGLKYDESIVNNYGFVNFVLNSIRALTISQKFTKEYFELTAEAHTFYQQKKFRKSAQTYCEAFCANRDKGLKDDYYNAACSWALANEPDSAFVLLEKCANEGYNNYSWAQHDKDLNSIHNDIRWKPLLEKIKQNE